MENFSEGLMCLSTSSLVLSPSSQWSSFSALVFNGLKQKLTQIISFAGVILFGATAVVIIVLSLLTAPIPKDELAGLTWATIRAAKTAKNVT